MKLQSYIHYGYNDRGSYAVSNGNVTINGTLSAAATARIAAIIYEEVAAEKHFLADEIARMEPPALPAPEKTIEHEEIPF